MKREYIFLLPTGAVFLALAVVFLFFPRSTFSEVERRELKEAPEFSFAKLFDGSYTAEVSSWFSDSQPFRDDFMTLSMAIKKKLALVRGEGEQQFVFHQTDDVGADLVPGGLDEEGGQTAENLAEQAERDIPAGEIGAADGEEAKMSRSGILIVGSGDNVRALMHFGGTPASGNPYVAMVNEYKRRLGPGVAVYSMVVPIAMEFYCPEEARRRPGLYKPQLPVIKHIYSSLSPDIHAVNVYTTLSEHTGEDIYLRTDHHWAPLGAYYAARKFAETAGVHVPDLPEFDRHVLHRFVGTMYGYSKDISVKNAPEDFVYYTPRDLAYTTTFTVVNVDKDFRITGESKPFKTSFFKKFKDGSGNAYLTFMGSDFLIVKVEGGPKNGRRLAIMKDSYGNALPGYLFRSFEEVHVLDFRYFPHNIVDYCRRNGITDFLFVNNIFNACSAGVASKTRSLLTRKDGSYSPVRSESSRSAESSQSTGGAECLPEKELPVETPEESPVVTPSAEDHPEKPDEASEEEKTQKSATGIARQEKML